MHNSFFWYAYTMDAFRNGGQVTSALLCGAEQGTVPSGLPGM